LDTNHARHLFQKTINQSIPGTISWAGHKFSLLEGKATFKDILLKGPKDNRLIKLDTLQFQIYWTNLTAGRLTFKNILLEKPTVLLSIHEDGSINLVQALYQPETKPETSSQDNGIPFNIAVKNALIKNGSFHYTSYNKDQILLPNIDLELRNGDLLRQIAQVTIESSAGSISINEILETSDVNIKARADVNKDRILVEQFEIKAENNILSAKGSCDLKSGKLDGEFSLITGRSSGNVNIKAIDDISGNFIIDALVSGMVNDPVFKASVKGANLSYQKVHLGEIAANFLFSKGKVSIKQFNMRNNQSDLDLSGSIQVVDQKTNNFLSNPSYDISIYDSKIFLEDFIQEMKGELSFSGSLTGDTARLFGNVSLKGNKIDTGLQKISKVTLEMHIDDNKLFIDQNRLEITPGEKINANGWISLDGKYNFQAVSKGISLSSIDKISDQKWDEAKMVFAFTGTGDIKNPKLTGKIGIHGLQVKDKIIDPISLNLDVADMTARISGKEPINLNMEIQLETLDINGSADFGRIDLHPVFKLAGYEEIFGLLDGRIELSGNIGAIEKIQAKIQIDELETFWEQNELLRANNQTFALKNGNISLSDIGLTLLKEGYLNLKGQADLNGILDFKTEARIPLKILEPFCDDVYDVEGHITCNATVSGTGERPTIKADILLEKIGLGTPFLSEKLHDLNGRIHFTPNIAIVENIYGKFNTGRFNLEGTVDLKDYKPLHSRIKLTAHAVPVHIPDTMDIVLSTELALMGNEDKSEVTGKIMILEGVYFRDVDLNLLSLVPRRSRSEKPVAVTDQEFLKNMSFDIAVGYRNPFVVENNFSFLELKPNLHIKGEPDRILLSGRARVEPGGIIQYQEKKFEVTRGIIDFLNPYKIEPTIDLEGKTKVREWTIFLTVSGTSDDLEFTLRSDPPEQNNDILYLLAFGKTVRESQNGEGSKSTSPAQMLASIMAEKLQKNLKDTTGLDTFELEYTTDSNGETNSDKVKVTLGKEISRRLSVKYGVETKDGKIVQRTITEYKFLENLLLDAYNDTEGDYGGGLKYRLEFR